MEKLVTLAEAARQIGVSAQRIGVIVKGSKVFRAPVSSNCVLVSLRDLRAYRAAPFARGRPRAWEPPFLRFAAEDANGDWYLIESAEDYAQIAATVDKRGLRLPAQVSSAPALDGHGPKMGGIYGRITCHKCGHPWPCAAYRRLDPKAARHGHSLNI